MTDAPTNPFIPAQPFQPQEPPATRPKKQRGGRKATPSAAERPKRRASKPKADPYAALAALEATAPDRKPRKPRVAKVAKAPRAGKVGINEIVTATVGLKADEAKLLLTLVDKLGALGKARKGKVVAALAQLFGG